MNRLTDGQTNRWTYEQTEIRGDGQVNRWRYRQTDLRTLYWEKLIDKQKVRKRKSERNIHTKRQAKTCLDKRNKQQINRWMNGWFDRLMDG